MKIAIVEIPHPQSELFYRDWAGGFGTRFMVGRSLKARLIEQAKKRGVSLPQVSIGYMVAILERYSHRVIITDTLPNEKVDYALVASSIINYREEVKFARLIKKRWGAAVGFFGPFAGNVPEIFEPAADFIVRGEPEAVAYRLAHGETLRGMVESPPVKYLDALPFPEWGLYDIRRFSYFPNLTVRPVIPVQSARGCPYGCAYCAYRANFSFRMRSPEGVVDELQFLKKAYGIRGVIFRDPIFTIDRSRSEAIARLMIKRNINLRWGCETHIKDLDIDLLDLLYEAGLRSINVGIESASEEVMKAAHRLPFDSKAHQEMIIRYCDEKKIRVTAFYILGLLSDTLQTIRDTIRYAQHLNTHTVSFNMLAPYPGTECYDELKEIVTEEFDHFTSFDPVIDHPRLSKGDLLRLKEEAFTSYYFRWAYVKAFMKRILWR
ncbi:MAG: radical SAM protein [Candidatus Omnitrophica bacterium]|nr:radical SAM protein [Candidatus Omnitrophota bacterium]